LGRIQARIGNAAGPETVIGGKAVSASDDDTSSQSPRRDITGRRPRARWSGHWMMRKRKELIHFTLMDYSVGQLSLAVILYILAKAKREDAEEFWNRLTGRQAALTGIVLEADANTIKSAVSEKSKAHNEAYFIVHME
jgi:hypothetical protein